MEIDKTYQPKKIEEKIYQFWEQGGFFKPNLKSKKKPFVIVIPPPNVTGSLHMGHALNNTIQDILIRWHRMRGEPTLWLPGTDHAGIATQNVLEKQLLKEGKTREDLGKKEFVKKIWQWVKNYNQIITQQLKKLGCSCDWSRQRFTLDKNYSLAVKTAFLEYQKKGWIYQGERVINWCPRCQTALSDIELSYQTLKSKLWYLQYPLKNSQQYIVVATTRPETMLGDTAIAVNPQDSRYHHLKGKTAIVPLINREIPLIEDKTIAMDFGSGAVKITPAHDFNDFEIAQKHHLPSLKIIDERGRITPAGKQYAGLTVQAAREKILADLKKEGLLQKTEDFSHNVPHCYRCGRVIEQLPSRQWFLKMEKLAPLAIQAVEQNKIKFIPSRWKKVYLDWMKTLKDWCISRQIWWGHRLPGTDDVLDTWFSSALWPFAALGWPQKTADLKRFYPTTVLSTARDILYLWVARMIFSGLFFMKQKPFETVYIHPTIFNLEGKRMSKSLGTGVDPLILIEKYGADATRFGLTYINTGVQDIKFDEKAILAGQKFANKIWNINRFIALQIKNTKSVTGNINQAPCPQTPNDRAILAALQKTTQALEKHLEHFRFGQAAHLLYDFVWHNLADKYLEQSKKQLENESLKANTIKILIYLWGNTLKLLHPFMPFVTEAIWQTLPGTKTPLIISPWPKE